MDRSYNTTNDTSNNNNNTLHQQPLKWRTETTHVDIETGEELTKKQIKKKNYLHIKTVKLKTTKNENIYTRQYQKQYKKDNQLRFEF